MKKVYFDLGHGGKDPGAVANGLQEKNVVLEIGKYINELMKGYEGVEWKFSRLSDKYLSLSERTNEANKWGADLLVSIHINAGGGKGFESFIYNGSWATKNQTIAMQNLMHDEMIKRMPFFYNRGKKQKNLHMVRESKMKAILTENGFIDNHTDASTLKDRGKLMKIAEAHVAAVAAHFGLKKKPNAEPKSSNGKLYKVQVGAFSDKKNADRLADDLKRKGYPVYIVQE